MDSQRVSENFQRGSPQNLEAECSVLGAILLNASCLNDVLGILKANDFYREAHRKIFWAMKDLSERGEPVDFITLGDLLKAQGQLESVGGSAYLCSFNEAVPTAANVAHYARIVKQYSQRRQLIGLLRDSEEQAYSSADDPLTIVGNLTSGLLELQSGHFQAFHISELLPTSLKDIEKAYESKGRIVGVPTGLGEFENSYGGLSRGDLAVIGGRTSMGKTSFATTIGKNAGREAIPLRSSALKVRHRRSSSVSSPKLLALRM